LLLFEVIYKFMDVPEDFKFQHLLKITVLMKFALTVPLNFGKCSRHMAKLIIWIQETHFYGINHHHPLSDGFCMKIVGYKG